jgi:hypothetical protein
MHGSKCDLVIRQGVEEKFLPTFYVENVRGVTMQNFTTELEEALASLPYDNLGIELAGEGMLKIIVPQEYRTSHEEHFGEVTARFLEYMDAGKLPDWEVPGMITKYYTTTTALKKAKGN